MRPKKKHRDTEGKGTQEGTPDITCQIEKQQILLDKEIMEGAEKLAIQKEKITGLKNKIEQKENDTRTMLDTQETDVIRMTTMTAEVEEGEIHELVDPRVRSNSLDGEVKETRIKSRPGRSNSVTSTPTKFVAPPNLIPIDFDKPEEGEQLSQPVLMNFKKRNKKEANLSQDDDLKEVDKRRMLKMRHENDVRLVRIGEFRQGYKNREVPGIKKKVETSKLRPDDHATIMLYLVVEKGDTTKLGLTMDERVSLVAYTLYLNAGDYKQAMDGHTTPRDLQSMWENPILTLWNKICDEKLEPKVVKNKYKTIPNTINNKR